MLRDMTLLEAGLWGLGLVFVLWIAGNIAWYRIHKDV
jgi:hypothetical protein